MRRILITFLCWFSTLTALCQQQYIGFTYEPAYASAILTRESRISGVSAHPDYSLGKINHSLGLDYGFNFGTQQERGCKIGLHYLQTGNRFFEQGPVFGPPQLLNEDTIETLSLHYLSIPFLYTERSGLIDLSIGYSLNYLLKGRYTGVFDTTEILSSGGKSFAFGIKAAMELDLVILKTIHFSPGASFHLIFPVKGLKILHTGLSLSFRREVFGEKKKITSL